MVLQLSDEELAGLLTVGDDELIGDRLMEEFNDQQQQVTITVYILHSVTNVCWQLEGAIERISNQLVMMYDEQKPHVDW